MFFNDSKYTRWYNQLIEQAKVRILPRDVYTEKQSASTRGRLQTKEHIEKRKCVGTKNGRYGYKMTAEEIARRTATMQKNKLAKKLAQEK